MADSMPSNYTVMTNAGLALLTQLANGENSIKSLRAVGSDVSNWDADPATTAAMTTIDSVKQDGVIADVFTVADNNTNNLTIQVDFDQSKITTAYQLNTVGLFATDANGKEILYAVECLQHPQYMEIFTSADMNTHYITIAVGNASQVDVALSTAGSVSKTELASKLLDYQPKGDYATHDDIKNVAYTDKPNTFSQQQTLSAGAVNGDGKKALFEGDVSEPDLSGLQPKGDYALKSDIKAPDLSSYLETADADKKYETQSHASATYETKNDANYHGIADGTDLFTILDKSDISSITYVCMTNVSAATMKNCPTKNAFILNCDSIDYNGGAWSNTLLKLTDLYGNIWVTVNSTGADGSMNSTPAWKLLVTSDDMKGYVGINPDTSQITNQTVKANVGQLLIGGQNAVGVMGDADPDEATAKSKSTDGLFHWTEES